MKKIISFIISASIIMQMIIPSISLVTYAAGEDHGFKKRQDYVIDSKLELAPTSGGDLKTVMTSWNVDNRVEPYVLEYFIIGAKSKPEKIQFTFKAEVDGNASATIEAIDKDNKAIEKEFNEYDFTSTNPASSWKKTKGDKLEIPIRRDAKFPGGIVKISDMEISFRWDSGEMYFQTNNIKSGNITPFSLTFEDTKVGEIDILTGIDGYKISPVHLEGDTTGSKDMIVAPASPGSMPGVKIEFKRPKKWNEYVLEVLDDNDGGKIEATLELEDLNKIVAEQLKFDLSDKPQVNTKLSTGKELNYDKDNNLYTLYLTKNGANHKNIVTWPKLEKSMILTKTDLNLKYKNTVKGLGIFVPESSKDGSYTYLGYNIERSSMTEAVLEIQPYSAGKDTEFTYVVESGGDDANLRELVKHTHMATGDNKEKPITISVPFSANYMDQYYKITITYGDVSMYSQILHYKPDQDEVVPPPIPVIQSIDNIYVVPPIMQGDSPATIGFDLTWSAPKNTTKEDTLNKLLEKGNIYYEVFLHESLKSTETADEKGTLIKTFKVSAEDNKVQVNPYAGTAGKDEAPESRYKESKDIFTMENIVLKNIGQDKWEQVKVSKDYDTKSNYPKEDDISVEDSMKEPEIPGIYYLTMRALYETKTTDAAISFGMGISHTSNPKPITISPLEEVIPIPTKIESKSLQDEERIIKQQLSWDNVDLYKYMKQMLDPLKLKVGKQGKGVYEIYLYQKKDKKTSPEAIHLDIGGGHELDSNDKDILRKGGTIRLDYTGFTNQGISNIVIKGLDSNQAYYTTIKVRLDIEDENDKKIDTRYSVFSKEISFTTDTKPNEPSPGERVPPVPEDLEILGQPNNTTAKIGWKAPSYTKQEDEKIYYEMVRVDSRELTKEENSRLMSVKELLAGDNKDEIKAWQTEKISIEDNTLKPNNIYYYYVRTVLLIGAEEVYSSWVGIPVTTSPIKRPTQLKIEGEKDYPHDPKREIVVSFLAPIPKDGKISVEYDFDIAVRGESDDDYSLNYPVTMLKSKAEEKDIPSDSRHFVYKIKNVKPGKRYDIKVRIEDRTIEMEDEKYSKSQYSDKVTTRTHFDQDEQDKEDKNREYLKYFEDKVEALRRRPYWTLENKSNIFEIKYRSNYIIPDMSSANTYPLEIKKDVSNFAYYMPAEAIMNANLNQTSFEIKQGSVTYIVRPSTITTDLQELKDVIKDIDGKYIKDYYVVFNFSQRAQSSRQTSAGYLTPDIHVDIELSTLREDDLFIEDSIMMDLNKKIESEKELFIDDLEKALKHGKILNEDLDKLINDSIEEIEKSHQKEVRNIISRNTRRDISINTWNKNMLIMAEVEGYAVAEGYRIERYKDIPLVTFNVGLGYGIETKENGIYVFKGEKIKMDVIPGVGGAVDLVSKYQLTDFFGLNGKIEPENIVSKRSVLGAMARVLGAQRGADYTQYLKQMNIKGINNIGIDLPLKKGEGIYLLMQVYEKTHRKPISTIHIKNRNAVSNIKQFNQLHQPYIMVAVDSKIYNAASNFIQNDGMKVKDILQMLNNIMPTKR